ncbi:ABC transporter ATP-binding protein [Franzmannia qiaohouensis]|uniref:ATP-binding cassette domain-containing protein n=1 Tax=Franzmannia qiaohouensis TaxID=1329370 RepID=A0ABU1HDY6_9GAMM|nr:ATP-binding cassette domain-containing protein [Halomonas qiaohouensis]MDR5904979.1 ATP-binding cassette domain-containing protein [Halomonas qiaohouensis]
MLEACDVTVGYRRGESVLRGISLQLAAGEWLGLSGASGSGKSTLGRVLAGHLAPRRGSLRLDGTALPRRGLHPVQWLPQVPELAVNPRWRIGRVLNEAWSPSAAQRRRFGIDDAWLERYPHELSGGELQRVVVLRGLAPGVRYLIADEITSMLDAITQAALWQALGEEAQARRLGVLVIGHDPALLQRLCQHRVRLEQGQLFASS